MVSDGIRRPADQVAYENTADSIYARKALDLYQERRLQVAAFDTDGVVSAQVWGTCPRCGHDLDVAPTLTTTVTDLRHGRSLWATLTGRAPHGGDGIPQTVEVNCGCGRPHPTAPENVLGCGVSFRLPTDPPSAGAPAEPTDPQEPR